MSSRSVVLLVFVINVSACGAGWQRLTDLTSRALPERTQVQVWQREQVTLLHAVEMKSDSVYGLPFTKAPTCDSCGVHISLVEVDSLRTGNKERAFFRTAGIVLAIGSVWAYLTRGIGGE